MTSDKFSRIKGYLKIVYPYVGNYKKLLVANIALVIIAALFESMGISLLVPALQHMDLKQTQTDNFIVEGIKEIFVFLNIEFTFINLILSFSVMILLKYFLIMLQQYYSRVLSSAIILDMRNKALCQTLNMPLNHFHDKKVGDLVSTIYISAGNAGGSIEYLIYLLKNIVFIIAYILLAAFLSPILIACVALVVLLSYYLIYPRFSKGRRLGGVEKNLIDLSMSELSDKLGGIKIVKSYNLEKNIFNRISKVFNKYRNNVLDTTTNRIFTFAFFEPFLFIVMVGVLLLAVEVLKVQLSILIVIILAFIQIIPQFKVANTNLISLMENIPHFLKVNEYIKKNIVGGLSAVEEKPLKKINSEIKLDKVSFNYNTSSATVISNVSFQIPVNQTIALVGMSGGGKSTLIDLLLKHYDPSNGCILVDGTNLKEIKNEDWKKITALVDQEAYLFHDSIINNIRMGNLNASDKEVFEASKLACAHKFIQKTEDGYDTIVGHKGTRLSGGQKQRIALARALVRHPQILLLDEATSSLDSESERVIQKSIDNLKGDMTIVMIAHRLSTIRGADNIIFIENGEIIESGTHEELYRIKNRYYNYYTLQSS